ncbi:1,4-alpha-glucan branching protein [Streptomyces sp. NPDC101227]|uniref:maltokinase N-terminal cap-like domain-containing protein n=1 Tax=Streptomyces sp. NPDC101227 TaxID=3366136 RepID=UPI0038117592
MAVIHHITLKPGKLELLTSWLPGQPWYAGTGQRQPELAKAGGFRLDDPDGEVGIEFMAVCDGSGDRPVVYHVPLTYRGAPLDGADHALVGTLEHEVLGPRWVYDATHDPVFVAQLFALLNGTAEPQAQSLTDTPDPSVTSDFAASAEAAPGSALVGSTVVDNGPHGTDIALETATAASGPVRVRVRRVLHPAQDASAPDPAQLRGHVTADWLLPDGTKGRGPYAVVPGDAAGAAE